jgi:hypothetical protein
VNLMPPGQEQTGHPENVSFGEVALKQNQNASRWGA